MHAFFLTARPPYSDLEQLRLRVVVDAVGFDVTPMTHTDRLLDLGLTRLMLNTALGRNRSPRLACRRARRLSIVLRLAVLRDPAAELVGMKRRLPPIL
jgi:hypothetical protein